MAQNSHMNGHESIYGVVGERKKVAPTQNGFHHEESVKPTYALDHLASFHIKTETEIRNPFEKLKQLHDLDKSGGISPLKMFMSFNGQWILMLNSQMEEIENFPGSLIVEPTAFISEDSGTQFNNLLVFTVQGTSLGNTEMHIFQVSDVSAILLVDDLRLLSKGHIITKDHNETPLQLPHAKQAGKDQYGIAVAAAGVAAEKNAHDREQTEKDILVLNHCFEDIERFVARLQYAAEAMRELEQRQREHNPHGEGLLILRSRPPTEAEFQDIFAKIKLALNYVTKLQVHFGNNAPEAISNIFLSLHTIVNVCNDVHIGANIPENVINPLLKRETVTYLNACLNAKDIEFWQTLGPNWTLSKDQFKDQCNSYHPIFYDDWSPEWVVDEEVPYLAPALKRSVPAPLHINNNDTWLSRLQSRNVKIAEVHYNKKANNDKELSVTKGEYLEVIDDSRNWWKARNSSGSIGYVPRTVLHANNFEPHYNNSIGDTSSLSQSLLEQDVHPQNGNTNNVLYRNTIVPYVPSEQRESQATSYSKMQMDRSISMPNVPVPPPMPQKESMPTTPTGTMKRNMAAAGAMAAMRARNDYDEDDSLILQDMNDELKLTLMKREKRKDLEILTTPQIYINQKSTPHEVEEWLRGKGFSDTIIRKLRTLNGQEIFALKPTVIESYFGQKESRRLISQIVLQKNISEYKTVRSSELSAKLAKAREKADLSQQNSNEIF